MTGPEVPPEGRGKDLPPATRRARGFGVVLLAGAVLMWAAAAVVVFLPFPGVQRVWTTFALLVGGEVFFWISALVLGRELFLRYRSRLDPRRLFGTGR